MTEYYVVYDTASGAARWRGSGSTGATAAQRSSLPEGLAVMEVPLEALTADDVDIEPVKAFVCAKIDRAAEALRDSYITPGSGQALTYQYKAQEALAWQADHNAPTPFLAAEAAALGMTLADLVAEVLAQRDAWIAIGSTIEGARRKAKADVTAAGDFAALAAASAVDWSGVGA